ncbi:MAG: 3'-5' exonuclease [Planctomycetota bacterium]
MSERVVYLDLETAGLEFTRPIIQIAAIAVDTDYRELEQIELKIRFDPSEADEDSLSLNRYDRDVWRTEAITPNRAALRFAAFLRRHATHDMLAANGRRYQLAQLAGHNAERFDGPFLHAWYRIRRVFLPARYMTLCTKQKALWLFADDQSMTPPHDFKLGTLCECFGVRLGDEDAHDALNDVRATVALARAMRNYKWKRHSEAA